MTPQVLTLPDPPFEKAMAPFLSTHEKQSIPFRDRLPSGQVAVISAPLYSHKGLFPIST